MKTLKFMDGSTSDLTQGLFLVGSENAEALPGTRFDDTLQGGVGNDTLSGWLGIDVYVFNKRGMGKIPLL